VPLTHKQWVMVLVASCSPRSWQPSKEQRWGLFDLHDEPNYCIGSLDLDRGPLSIDICSKRQPRCRGCWTTEVLQLNSLRTVEGRNKHDKNSKSGRVMTRARWLSVILALITIASHSFATRWLRWYLRVLMLLRTGEHLKKRFSNVEN
jgi:hypothetical protein